MTIRDLNADKKAIDVFKTNKVLTIYSLSKILNRSFITIRRRLKEWKAYTSYNKNGRYYTLPSIPKFSKKGLWKYQGIFFSKYGTFKKTIIHFVKQSKKGLSNFEIEEILGINPNSFLPHFKKIKELKKEKHGKEVVYYSSEEEIYKMQKEKRFPPEPPTIKLPPDAISIIILVELIRNPGCSIKELTLILNQKRHNIEESSIRQLLEYHKLLKKTLDIK